MRNTANSATYKLITQNRTPDGILHIYEYKAQVFGVRLLINAPWRIEDLETWLVQIQNATNQPVIVEQTVNKRHLYLIEKSRISYKDVQECEAICDGNYPYIFYKSAGEAPLALRVLRAVVEVDKDRFLEHIHAPPPPFDDTLVNMEMNDEDITNELGRTAASYHDVAETGS